MATSVAGKITDVVYVRLDPDDDVLAAIKQAVREHGIRTGVVMNITGGVKKARLQKFPEVGDAHKIRIGVVEVDGPLEVTGTGLIGMTKGSGGTGEYVDGDPYVHVHLVATSANETICGHLMPGTVVRSNLTTSHFTIILGKAEGVELTCVIDKTTSEKGRVYHDLVSTAVN